MKTGSSGTFVVSWAQTEFDGQAAGSVDALRVGMEWSWAGQAVRVDGPTDVLPLGEATGEGDLHQRAALILRKLSGWGVNPPRQTHAVLTETPLLSAGFVVTDGREIWAVAVSDNGPDKPPLAMFVGDLPPRDRTLWVVSHSVKAAQQRSAGVICFTPGTLIQTESGPRLIEDLAEGDKVQTKDNGGQEVLWIGRRHLTGARLYAMPRLRPVRISAGALDHDVPDAGLVVSPDHRIILRGPRAQSLFNHDEVLVRARDLINDRTIVTDYTLRDVTYIHLLLPEHQIVFANGVETESFHPAGAALDAGQWSDVDTLIPNVTADPFAYGSFARRVLTQSEAAILRYDLH